MRKLISILGKTDHKYIITKGPRHEEYATFPSNMYGEQYLPETKIIPNVDLVITNGRNSTITEVISEAKPMIVLPFQADEFDNAQRVQETGFGLRLDPYNFTGNELIDAIEKLLYDYPLSVRLEQASKRIKSLKKHKELAIKIEEMFCKSV